MDAARFAETSFGRATIEPGNRWGFTYYLPNPIPRDIPLAPRTITLLSEADAFLGQLEGLGTLIRDPSLLVGPYLRREALASSRIEGTQASLSEIFRSEVDGVPINDDTAEVDRYLRATQQAYGLAKELPIAQRLILEVHRTLLTGVRGEERSPGELRRSPVWIGAPADTPETALFVPPLPHHLGDLLTDWERFVNDDGRHLPVLIHAALMHYQFETIHPFLDGNGRIGRLLINLLLMDRGRLSIPLLYLSGYFETNRERYYARLQGVRERGAIDDWLQFFLIAVRDQARDGIARSRTMLDLRERYTQEALSERSSLPRLVDLILHNPFVTVKYVSSHLDISGQGARNLIWKAEDRGWLQSLGSRGRGGRQYWFAPELLAAMEGPMAYEQPPL